MAEIPADAWPAGDRLAWHDDATRTFHDFIDNTTRPYTAAEGAAADARIEADRQDRNGDLLRSAAVNALAGNRTFLAIAAPTNAQTLAQVRALTRQMNALARLAVNDLSGTD